MNGHRANNVCSDPAGSGASPQSIANYHNTIGLHGGKLPEALNQNEVIEMPKVKNKEVTGFLQAVKMEGQRLAVCIDDTWYSGFPKSFPVLNQGDEATIGYKETSKNGQTYYDIVYVKRTGDSRPVVRNDNGRIVRSVALKAAATLNAGFGAASIDKVLETATKMEQWLHQGTASEKPVEAEA